MTALPRAHYQRFKAMTVSGIDDFRSLRDEAHRFAVSYRLLRGNRLLES